ncbi:MAG: capsid protein [Genomoviridae sp.]|nr:MAG: capsid protein [Genomoviridae sp.]
MAPAPMAYRRKYTSRRSRPKRKSSRRSYGKRPTRRARTTRRNPSMSRKRLLNITSRKKKNTMLVWSNTNNVTGASQATQPAPITANGNTAYRGFWIATAQDLTDQTGILGRVGEEAVRTATSCYMRGVAEHLRIQTSSALPWFWRRICFTYKGPELTNVSSLDSPTSSIYAYLDTTSGMQRLGFNQNVANMPNTINNHDSIIFRGAKGLDWQDYIVAPVDNSRVSLKFDKTWTLRSGNQSGTVKEVKLWHPMNKTLMYGDDESGDLQATNYTSVSSKIGMGDYYIMDIIAPGQGGTASDLMVMVPNTTLYWHEK